jgi:hypothetical protein
MTFQAAGAISARQNKQIVKSKQTTEVSTVSSLASLFEKVGNYVEGNH